MSTKTPEDLMQIGHILQLYERMLGGRITGFFDIDYIKSNSDGYRYGSYWSAHSKIRYGVNHLGQPDMFYLDFNGDQKSQEALATQASNLFGIMQQNMKRTIDQGKIRMNDVWDVQAAANADLKILCAQRVTESKLLAGVSSVYNSINSYASFKTDSDRLEYPLAFFDPYIVEGLGLEALARKETQRFTARSENKNKKHEGNLGLDLDDTRVNAPTFCIGEIAAQASANPDAILRDPRAYTFNDRFKIITKDQMSLPDYADISEFLASRSHREVALFCANARKKNDAWTALLNKLN